MSTEASGSTTRTTQKRIADELASDADRIGIDTQGRVHYYSRIRGQVLIVQIVSPSEAVIAGRTTVPAGCVEDYLKRHAAERDGWESINVAESATDALAGRTVEVA